NPVYVGEIRHREERHPGQHQAIVDRELWDEVQLLLSQQAAHPRGEPTNAGENLLAGNLFDEAGEPLDVSGATKGQRRYRYYVTRRLVRNPADETQTGWRLPAREIERAVISAAAKILKDRSAIGTLLHESGLSSQNLVGAFKSIDELLAGFESGRDSAAMVAR